MKAYGIFPTFEMYQGEDTRTSHAIELIAELVFKCLREGGDTFQFAVDWANPGEPPSGVFSDDIAVPQVVNLESDSALLDRLRRSVDPNIVEGGTIRSIATCRSVTFGYDGQAFLCLRYDDPAPLSPDKDLVLVEQRNELLYTTDLFDGRVSHVGNQDVSPGLG